MKDLLTDYEILLLDFSIDQWIERNEFLSDEIKAYKTLLALSNDREDAFGMKFQAEIQRRRVFLKELMRDF